MLTLSLASSLLTWQAARSRMAAVEIASRIADLPFPAFQRRADALGPKRSDQPHLRALGWAEQIGAKLEARLGQAIAADGFLEARAEQIGPRALAAHPAKEIGIVVAAAAERVDRRHDLGDAVGEMLVEPGAEQGRD